MEETTWEQTVKKADGGIKSISKICHFFRTVAQLEAEFGRRLLQTTNISVHKDGPIVDKDKDIVHQNDYTSVGTVWDAFNRQVFDRASKSLKTASEVESLMDELEAWTKEQSAVKKRMVDEVYRLKKEVIDHQLAVNRALAAQSSACAECDKSIEVYGKLKANANVQDRDKQAAKKNAKQALEKATKAIRDYQKEVTDSNKYRTTLMSRLVPDLMAEFRAFEESRVAVVKSNFQKLSACMPNFSLATPNAAAAKDALARAINDLDISCVAASLPSATGQDGSRGMSEAVIYDSNFPDFVKSRTARIAGTEDIPSSIAANTAPAATSSALHISNNSSSLTASTDSNVSGASLSASMGGGSGAPASMGGGSFGSASSSNIASGGDERGPVFDRKDSTPHFAEVMPNSVVALGVESKREILRTQLAQLQLVILTEKRVLMDLISLIRFYGGSGTAATKAREEYVAQKQKLSNLLGARKQVFTAMEKVGTTPSVFATLSKNRYGAVVGGKVNITGGTASAASSPGVGITGASVANGGNNSNNNNNNISNSNANLKIDQKSFGSAPAGAAPAPNTPTTPAANAIVKATCLFNYKAATEKELSFKKGESLIIRDEDDSGWWYAENEQGVLGFIPANHVKKAE